MGKNLIGPNFKQNFGVQRQIFAKMSTHKQHLFLMLTNVSDMVITAIAWVKIKFSQILNRILMSRGK